MVIKQSLWDHTIFPIRCPDDGIHSPVYQTRLSVSIRQCNRYWSGSSTTVPDPWHRRKLAGNEVDLRFPCPACNPIRSTFLTDPSLSPISSSPIVHITRTAGPRHIPFPGTKRQCPRQYRGCFYI